MLLLTYDEIGQQALKKTRIYIYIEAALQDAPCEAMWRYGNIFPFLAVQMRIPLCCSAE